MLFSYILLFGTYLSINKIHVRRKISSKILKRVFNDDDKMEVSTVTVYLL